jgi:hypothetical protein
MSLILIFCTALVFVFLNLYLLTAVIEVSIPETTSFKKWWRKYVVSSESEDSKNGGNVY